MISSANLTHINWTKLSQVIWYKDFYLKKTEDSKYPEEAKEEPMESGIRFKTQLKEFLYDITPEIVWKLGKQNYIWGDINLD